MDIREAAVEKCFYFQCLLPLIRPGADSLDTPEHQNIGRIFLPFPTGSRDLVVQTGYAGIDHGNVDNFSTYACAVTR